MRTRASPRRTAHAGPGGRRTSAADERGGIRYALDVVARLPEVHYSFAEYAEYEARSADKHEFVSGLILAMAGGTLEHGALAAAVVASLVGQLRGRRCRVYDSDARVRARATGDAYYPDASVVCDQLETDPDDAHSMVNPVVLVEVLIPSTEDYDRGTKLDAYRSIESLRHIVYVAHAAERIDVWTRGDTDWRLASYAAGDAAELAAIGCRLVVSEIYHDPLSPP